MHAVKTGGQFIAAIQIAAQSNVFTIGIQFQQMQDMIANRAEIRLIPNEGSALVEAGNAARFAISAEHIIRQIAAVAANSAGIGMGGNNGLFGDLHDIPEALVRNVAHIDQNTKTLGFTKEFPALIRQAAAGHIGAGQIVLFIPAKGSDAEAGFVHHFQQFRVKTDTRRAFNGQNSGHFAIFQVLLHIIGRKCQFDLIPVHLHLGNDHG